MTPPVGRETELAALDAFLQRAETGPEWLALEGEPGMGKTTLWRAGIELAQARGFRVLEARPVTAERTLTFAGLGDLLAACVEVIDHLPSPQRRALRIALVLAEPDGEPPDERAIAVATLGLLRRLAADSPLLVAVDDLQWLDPGSRTVLTFALRRLEHEGVGILTTARADGTPPLTEPWDGGQVQVGPLSLQALDRMIRMRLGVRFLRPTLKQLEQTSGGNPFYALELAASLLRTGRSVVPGEPLPIPGRLRELIGERLVTLSPAGKKAALSAAALAQPSEALLGQLVPRAAILEAVEAAVLVRESGFVRVAHPLLASALYEDASAADRRRLHRRLARLVTDPEEQAEHLAKAAVGPDEICAAALERAAATVAARGAPERAAALARWALELTPTERGAASHRRRLVLSRYVFAAGDPGRAEALLREQLEQTTAGRRRAEVVLELGRVAFATRGSSYARVLFQEALRDLEPSDGLDLRADAVVELAALDIEDWQVDGDTVERALALAEQVGKPSLLARALGLYATKLDLSGAQPSEDYWRRALAVEAAAGELHLDGPTAAYGATLAFLEGKTSAGRTLMERVADSMRRRFDPMLPILLLRIADVARNAGHWDEADRYIAEAGELIAHTGRDALVPHCLLCEGRMAMLRGDFGLARTKANEALTLLDTANEAALVGLAHSIFGRIAAQLGFFADAHRQAAETLGQFRLACAHSTPIRITLPEPLAEEAACLVALGRLEQAAGVLDELTALAAELRYPPFDSLVARTRGLLATARGETGVGIAAYEEAVALLEALPDGWPYELGRTLLLLGTAQRRARQKLAARTTLQRALEIFERLGAQQWAEKTHAELRQIGGRPAQPGRLTETERRIAELVAAGRSNAETARELSLSSKTIEWNLSKIYRKLHVRSRTELAAKLARRQVIRS